MRTIRLRRVAVLFAASLGLLATMAPPASAANVETAVFEGTATLTNGPLSYPCVASGPTVVVPPAMKCPTVTVSPTTTKPITVTGGNTRNFMLNTTVCVSGAVEEQGPPKVTTRVSAGLCVLKALGTVTGSCGLSSGLGTWLLDVVHTLAGALFDGTVAKTFVDVVVVTRSGSFHWTGVGGTLVVTGTVTGGGTISATVQATPPPGPGTPPSNSCAGKSATTFQVQGAALLVIP